MIARDINVIANPNESSNFNGSYVMNSSTKEFVECMQQLAVMDHAYTRLLFMWSNHQDFTFLVKKLDRVLINDDWLVLYAHSIVEFLAQEISYHSPALIQLEQVYSSTPKPFKFF